MYYVSLWLDGELLEFYNFKTLNKATEKNRVLLAEYLVGYGVIWDEIEEEEHRQILLSKTYDDLKEIEWEAKFNKELDYDIKLEILDEKIRKKIPKNRQNYNAKKRRRSRQRRR